MLYNIILKRLFPRLYTFKSSSILNTVGIFFLSKSALLLINLFFKFSIFFHGMLLLDIVCYTAAGLSKNILIYSYKIGASYLYLLITCSKKRIQSIEFFFRNATWLEREVSDFYGIFFSNKKDRRTLYSIPLVYNSPLEKVFPVNGFYEIFLCFFLKKLKFRHNSYKA